MRHCGSSGNPSFCIASLDGTNGCRHVTNRQLSWRLVTPILCSVHTALYRFGGGLNALFAFRVRHQFISKCLLIDSSEAPRTRLVGRVTSDFAYLLGELAGFGPHQNGDIKAWKQIVTCKISKCGAAVLAVGATKHQIALQKLVENIFIENIPPDCFYFGVWIYRQNQPAQNCNFRRFGFQIVPSATVHSLKI